MCFWGDPVTQKSLEADPRTMSDDLFSKGLQSIEKYTDRVGLTASGEFMSEKNWESKISKIVEVCRQNPNLGLHQITNATLLTKKNIQKLKGIRRVTFLISIDGDDPIIYASIRKRGSLHKTLKNVRNLRKNLYEIGVEFIELQLSMTLMKRNILTVPSMIDLAKDIDARLVVDHVQNYNREFNKDESLYNFPTFSNDFLAKCQKLADARNVRFSKPPPFAITNDEIEEYYDNEKSSSKFKHCSSLDEWGPITVSANGDVSVCCGDLVFGNLNFNSFDEILNSDQYDIVRNSIKSGEPIGKCATCRWLLNGNKYLHECHEFDIPPNQRCYEKTLNFKNHGFFDYLEEFDHKSLVQILTNFKNYDAKRVVTEQAGYETLRLNKKKKLVTSLLNLTKNQSPIVVYPRGVMTERFAETPYFECLNIVACSDIKENFWGEKIKKVNIVNPEKIQQIDPYAIIITVTDNRLKEILAYLNEVGCGHIQKIFLDADMLET